VTTPAADWVRRFAVEHREVRGELVRLGPAWLALREHADYPPPVRRLLGEAVAAVVLLASTLKFEGELTLQMQGDGAVRLLVAQCTHDLRIRAVARFDAGRLADDFATLAGTGSIVVTIESDRMQSRYQGIVPIDGASLAATLEHYFENSEQLPTRVQLAADDASAAGLLVQRLPQQGGIGADLPTAAAAREAEAWATFEAASAAVADLGADELQLRAVSELLQRALPGFDVRLFDERAVRFECRCSRERVAGMLRTLGAAEVQSIVAEQGAVTVTCEFCQKPWRFDAVDAAGLFGAADAQPPVSPSVN